jgi:hypothetical protein
MQKREGAQPSQVEAKVLIHSLWYCLTPTLDSGSELLSSACTLPSSGPPGLASYRAGDTAHNTIPLLSSLHYIYCISWYKHPVAVYKLVLYHMQLETLFTLGWFCCVAGKCRCWTRFWNWVSSSKDRTMDKGIVFQFNFIIYSLEWGIPSACEYSRVLRDHYSIITRHHPLPKWKSHLRSKNNRDDIDGLRMEATWLATWLATFGTFA